IKITRDVRLLRVIQGSSGGTVQCRLLAVKLSELAQPRYRTVSYVWGQAIKLESVQTIIVDGQSFRVSGMARIYRNANMVVAWLGALGAEQSENVRSLSLDRDKNCSSWSTEQWAGLRYLSYHPYWSRIWIIKEVILATSMTVWCGCFVFLLSLLRSSISRDAMTTRTMHDFKGRPTSVHHHISQSISPAEMVITHRLREVTGLHRDPLAQGTEVGTLEEMTHALQRPHSETVTYQSHIPDTLYQIMDKFGKLICSDPRDKLYGLLGLLGDSSSSLILPDYERGVDYAFSQALATGIK
ncbi:hypothetical protein PG996_008397, partial [Apiospora saccharicola]